MENEARNLLIVDDNESNSDLLKETFSTFKFNIFAYNNPLEALLKSKNEKIDLAVLDVIMPDMNGFEFAEQFLQTHTNTPIIFVSAHGDNENKIKGFNLGSFAYVDKPFDVNTMRARVSSILKIKSLQDALFAEKEKLDNIYAFANDEIILTDINFNITSKNNRLLIGGAGENANFTDILEKYRQYEAIKILREFVDSDKKQISFKMSFEEFITRTKVSKMMDKQNNLMGYLIVILDITDEIEYINQKEQFIATLTHDLKTPIRAESKALELLMNGSFGELTAEQKNIVREIYGSSRFMARMTDNLLTHYKIAKGEICLYRELHSIKMTIQKCADNIKYLLEAKNQVLKINADIEEDMFMYDDLEITRAMNNLLTNASEYSDYNAEITIQVARKENNVEISVIDNGTGINEYELKTIFNEHASSSKRFKKVGAGIGLFITKKIVESHGGTISVLSEPGKGSCFTVAIPFNAVPASEVR
jgi:signal transduction histidine kinase